MGNTERQRAGGHDPRQHLNDEVLNAYLDQTTDGLSPTARSYATAHLADCAECRMALDGLATTVAILGAMPDVALRRSFILTPEAAAAAGGPRLPRQLPRWVWPTRWATALAALIFAFTVGLGYEGSPPAAQQVANPTAARTVISATQTPCAAPGCLTSFVDPTSVIIFPTPTAIAQPASPPRESAARGAELRPVQLASGLLTLLGASCGFVLPAVFRRRRLAA
ncbi:MAG TPA: hypothetical protein VIL85_03295 [Thermomicrobiales bacterium]|jgi:anti-sigma factor RsiW